ncbi:MAG TPA: hypothetical protein VF746_23990 [Longimicrobium sp.]|jgi:hypothetical protein
MGLFDRNNYDREYGRWGGSPEYGGGRGRGFMGGVRRGFQRLEHGVRDAFDRGGYDRDYGARGRWGGGAGREFGGYDRGYGWAGGHTRDPNPAAGGGEELNRHRRSLGDEGNYGYRGTEGAWSTIRNHGRYDEDLGRGPAWGAGYDRDYAARRGMVGGAHPVRDRDWDRDERDWERERHRMETDTGDPFGDRQSRTPFRVMRGGFEDRDSGAGGWGEGGRPGWQGRGRYDESYRGWNQGLGDEPYYGAGDLRGYDRGYGRHRRDWF